MKNFVRLIALFAAFVLLAGCAQNVQQPPQPSAPPQVSISIVSAPSTAAAGSQINVSWKVASSKPASTMHTAIHYGYASVASDPAPSKYPNNSAILKGDLPGDFTASISAGSSGTLYYRAHVIVNDKSYWTDEKTISVTEPLNVTELQKGLDSMDQTVEESINDLGQVQ